MACNDWEPFNPLRGYPPGNPTPPVPPFPPLSSATCAGREDGILAAVNALEQSVTGIAEQLSQLENQLVAVLGPAGSTGSACGAETQAASPLISRLKEITRKLNYQTNRIATLRDRIQL